MNQCTSSSVSEIDQDRLERLASWTADAEPNWAEHFKPGSFGCHELLDRLALFSSLIDERIAEHPSCLMNPEWYALARHASEALADLYQRVGNEHV